MTRSKRSDSETPSVQIAVRFPRELLERLERYLAFLNQERPGLMLTRADAVRVLVHERLDEVEAEAKKKPR